MHFQYVNLKILSTKIKEINRQTKLNFTWIFFKDIGINMNKKKWEELFI